MTERTCIAPLAPHDLITPISSPVGGFRSYATMNYVGHMSTMVVERITDYYSMSGARRGPDGRFVRVDGLRDRLALSSKTGGAQGFPSHPRRPRITLTRL